MMLEEFQEFRKILCICPCCGEMVRVSDLKIKVKNKIEKTWLDKHEAKIIQLEKEKEEFSKIEMKIREQSVEKGRKAAEEVFNKCINPNFRSLKIDPYDLKPILHPVDFIVFKGMSKGNSIEEINFFSHETENDLIKNLRNQVHKAIENKDYDWRVARISEVGNIEFKD